MPIEITCPFTIQSSHEINEIAFRGGGNVMLTLPFHQKDFLGIIGTNLKIDQGENGRNYFVVNSDSLKQKEEQVQYIENVAEFLSLIINRDEHNPHYGNSYVEVEWFEFKTIQVQEDGQPFGSELSILDALAISTTRMISLKEEPVLLGKYHDLLRFYFGGLKAESKKSKYFHWFLILEYLENSAKYKALFSTSKLFDETEEQLLKDVANQMNDGVKKSSVLQLLSRTKEFRNVKLLKLINALGINNIKTYENEEILSKESINHIIKGRNALFHSAFDFPESTLWKILFPLVTQIVEQVLCDKGCLDAQVTYGK